MPGAFAHPGALPQQALSPRIAIGTASVASRLIFGTAAQLADSAGDILLTIASWMLMEALAGSLAYGNAAQPCAGAKCATRSEQTPGLRSGWRTAIIASPVLLLSKIREVCARHRTIAELRNLDDRSLSDVGIFRADIAYIAMHGVRPEGCAMDRRHLCSAYRTVRPISTVYSSSSAWLE